MHKYTLISVSSNSLLTHLSAVLTWCREKSVNDSELPVQTQSLLAMVLSRFRHFGTSLTVFPPWPRGLFIRVLAGSLYLVYEVFHSY